MFTRLDLAKMTKLIKRTSGRFPDALIIYDIMVP